MNLPENLENLSTQRLYEIFKKLRKKVLTYKSDSVKMLWDVNDFEWERRDYKKLEAEREENRKQMIKVKEILDKREHLKR